MIGRKCYLTVRDEVWCFITGLSPDHVEILYNEFGVYVDGYFFMPAYKLGRFDGKIRFYQKNGKTYVRLLDKILPYIEKWGYDIELVDHRKFWEAPITTGQITKVDSAGIAVEATGLDIFGPVEIRPGQVFKLRPYQLQCVQTAIEAGSGFIIAGTGSGKTSITAAISYFYGEKGYKIITIVPSGDLVTQTKDWYELLGLDTGVYSGDEKDIEHAHVVATWQAIQHNPSIMQEFQVLIWDECFCGETPVLMSDMTEKKIKDIRAGDYVLSMDANGNFEPCKVLKTHINLPKSKGKMLRLTFDNGHYLDVTENHIFYLKDGRRLMAKDLTEHDDICEFSLNELTHGNKANEE
jgi:hypothetical protein